MAFEGSFQAATGFAGPLYAQVAAMLRGKIASQEWNSAAPLPNEVALARTIGVSIGTMRKALEILESERLIERRQGRGTFVVEASEETELARFSKLTIAGAKVRAKAADRSVSAAVANDLEYRKLGLVRGDKVIRIETVWKGDGGYAAIETIAVSADRFDGLDVGTLPDGQLLFPLYRQRFQVVVAWVDERVACTAANVDQSARLRVDIGAPLLTIERLARERGGAPVEYSQRAVSLGGAVYCVTTM